MPSTNNNPPHHAHLGKIHRKAETAKIEPELPTGSRNELLLRYSFIPLTFISVYYVLGPDLGTA